MTTKNPPAGKFDGIDTLELPLSAERAAAPRPERRKPVKVVTYTKCPGCDTGRGVIEDGTCRRIREHLHPTTKVACSRSLARVHDVWDQAAKQPAGQQCGCYRG